MALYICWGEGYSHLVFEPSPRGMEEVSRERGRVMVWEGWSGALERLEGM